MKNDTEVRITVRGIHQDGDGGEAVTEFTGRAVYYDRGGSRYLIYEEADAEGGSTKNILKWRKSRTEPDKSQAEPGKSQEEPDGDTRTVLELNKRGNVNARMVFEPGKTHMTDYATPCGLLQLGVQTATVLCLEEEDTVELRAEYALTAQDEVFDRCRIVVRAAH